MQVQGCSIEVCSIHRQAYGVENALRISNQVLSLLGNIIDPDPWYERGALVDINVIKSTERVFKEL